MPNRAGAVEIHITTPDLDEENRFELLPRWTQVRFAGHTDPEAELRLEGEAIRVWPTGAFVGLLRDLEVGENLFTLEAAKGGETAALTICIARPVPKHPLPPSPAVIDEKTIEPDAPVMVLPSEELVVSFRGSAGGQASATLGARTRVRMAEVTEEPGFYRGVHRVTGDEGWSDDDLTVRLAVERGDPPRVEVTLPSLLWNLDPEHFPVIEVSSPDRRHAPLYPDTAQSSRLMDLPEGTHLSVAGQRDGHWRILLAPNEFAWVPVNGQEVFTRRLPPGAHPPRGHASGLAVQALSGQTVVDLGIEVPLPVRVFEHLGSSEIELRLFGLTGVPPRPTSALPTGIVERMQWVDRGEEIWGLMIALRKRLWGWNLRWEDRTLRFRLRSAPPFAPPPASPLEGLHIVLDPGHGGAERGAIGPTGLEEKESNLALSRRVEKELASRGARVSLLRGEDREIGLNERVQTTESLDPDLFVSLHCNSIPLTVDPLARQGASVHLSHPHCEDLAAAILRRLSVLGGIRDDGIHEQSFRVTRPSARPSVLLELLFLSHPEDEAKLLDLQWQSRLADAVASGIEDWVRAQRDGPSPPPGP